jgi:tryptophan-rich sensory protein
MKNDAQYFTYRKPSWAPPAWLFAPVWSFLYIIIAASFGYVGYLFYEGTIPFVVLIPFILNIIFNVSFTPIQFGLRSFVLALADIVLVLATLVWLLISIYPYAPWVMFANIPYLAWVCFATALQVAVTGMNRKA